MAKAADDVHGSFRELLSGGTLAMMLDPDAGTQDYQAVAPFDGEMRSDALEG